MVKTVKKLRQEVYDAGRHAGRYEANPYHESSHFGQLWRKGHDLTYIYCEPPTGPSVGKIAAWCTAAFIVVEVLIHYVTH